MFNLQGIALIKKFGLLCQHHLQPSTVLAFTGQLVDGLSEYVPNTSPIWRSVIVFASVLSMYYKITLKFF